ncbi:MAG: efflux RND transporter periplasmic adaptor subunit [Gemmatimonadales bacterium]
MKLAGGVIALVFLVLIAVGIVPRVRDARELKAESASVHGTLEVTVVPAKRAAPTSALVLPGSIESLHESPIYARTAGYVERWTTDIGARVSAGQLLAQIQSPEIDQQSEQAKADLGQLRANLNLAKRTVDRWALLAHDSVVTPQEVDEKQAAYDAAVANLASGEANYKRLEQLQSFERVTAPFAGVVTSRSVDVGNLVNAGATLGGTGSASGRPLFTVAGTDTVRVYVNVPQSAINLVQHGAAADILVRELPGSAFRGIVARNARALDAASRTLLTEVQIPNPKGVLLPGMYVEVRFAVTDSNPPLIIPANTLVIRTDGPQVALVRPNNTVHYQKIELGRDYGDRVEVVGGLDGDAKLIVNPTDDIREGVEVRVLPPVADTN